jgi:hypothetical protein
VTLEVPEEAAGTQRFFVGAVVVLAQEDEVSVGPPHGPEHDQVKPAEGAAVERGSVEAGLDGSCGVVWMFGGDFKAGLVEVRPEVEGHGSPFRNFL